MIVHYFDNHLLLVEKPAGLLTQPTPEESESLENQVKEWVKEKMQKKGAVFLHAVHRLDRVASGIVLFAKTTKALERLNSMQKKGAFTKIYIAEVEGIVDEDEQTLVHYLSHNEFKAQIADTPFDEAKRSELSFEVIKRKKNSTILLVILKTGRYHQIRAQLSFIGYPIIHDEKYGAKRGERKEIHLHNAYLSFKHPVTNDLITCFSAPPFYPDLKASDLGF